MDHDDGYNHSGQSKHRRSRPFQEVTHEAHSRQSAESRLPVIEHS
jgi:hypothetical protein